jgi:hypothetical protein
VRMWAATLRHTEMAGELTAVQSAVSSAAELVLVNSPNETSRVELMNDMVTQFRILEELCSRLLGPGAMICVLLLELPLNQA